MAGKVKDEYKKYEMKDYTSHLWESHYKPTTLEEYLNRIYNDVEVLISNYESELQGIKELNEMFKVKIDSLHKKINGE